MMGIIAGLVLLCILVVVHELGHFIFAKALGVRVLTFSVGFGPKLFGFKRGETEYRFSAILLGGYVKMYGESFTDVVEEEDKKHSFMHQPVWKKSLIAFAGPLFNFILPVLLFFFVLLGSESVLLPVAGVVLPDQAADKAGLLQGDRILAVNGQAVSTFTEVVQEVSSKPGQAIGLDIERLDAAGAKKHVKLTVVPTAEPNPHPLYQGQSIGRMGVMPAIQKPQIAVLHSQSVAAKAGFLNYDEVVSVDGYAVASAKELFDRLLQNPQQAFELKVKRLLSDGSTTILKLTLPVNGNPVPTFKLDGKMKRYAVTEDEIEEAIFQEQVAQAAMLMRAAEKQIGLQRGLAFIDGTLLGVDPKSAANELGLQPGDRLIALDGKPVFAWVEVNRAFEQAPDDHHLAVIVRGDNYFLATFRLKDKAFGEQMTQAYGEGPVAVRQVGAFEALKRSLGRTSDLIEMTLKSLWMLLSFQVPVSQLGGPIMILGVAGEAAAQGFSFYIYIMSLVSVNLGLLNLLPIPVLDGGHLLMFGIEAVQRRPLSLKTRQLVTQIGMIFILALTAIALFNDFSRLFQTVG
jgi:regulator of sigma E protease